MEKKPVKFQAIPAVRRRCIQLKLLNSDSKFRSGASFKFDHLTVLKGNVVLNAENNANLFRQRANSLKPRGPRSRSNESRLDFDFTNECSEGVIAPIKVPFCPGQAREMKRRLTEQNGPQRQADHDHLQAKEYIRQQFVRRVSPRQQRFE